MKSVLKDEHGLLGFRVKKKFAARIDQAAVREERSRSSWIRYWLKVGVERDELRHRQTDQGCSDERLP